MTAKPRKRIAVANNAQENAPHNGVPAYDKLLYPTIKALKTLGGSGTIEEITNKVIDLEKISSSVAMAMHLTHSMTALEYRLAWARSYS